MASENLGGGSSAYWIPAGGVGGILLDVKVVDYVGSGANSREIDLGADFQEILIIRRENANQVNRIIHLWAFLELYGYFTTELAEWGSAADPSFQGKMTGVDASKIKLGSNGILSPNGSNQNGALYRIIAKRYDSLS